MTGPGKPAPGRPARCATCGGPVAAAAPPRPRHFPFCSERCQLVDLGRWLDEAYRVPEPADQAGGGAEPVAPVTPSMNDPQ